MLIVALLALVALVVGCAGLGRLARPLAGLSESDIGPALPLLGLGILVWLTLVLNVTGLFTTWILVLVVGLGVALSVSALVSTRPRLVPDRPMMLAGLVVAAPILALVLIPPEINASDDGPAYLLFSEKLARLGTSGPEPFSERRLYGLGGQFGLVAMIRDLFGARWLSLYEPGLGLTLIGAWLLLVERTSPMSRLVSTAIVFGVAVVWLTLTAKPIANVAPAVLYAAVLFGAVEAWLRTVAEPARRVGWFRLLAVFCALALTLRPTAAPFIGLLAATAALPVIRRRDWKDLAAAVGMAGVILAPALLSSLQASQTLFYPFLGSGVHVDRASASSSVAESLATSAKAYWTWILLGLSGLVWLWLRRTGQAPAGGLILLGLTAVAIGLIAVATGGLALDRYAFPVLFAVFGALSGRIELTPETASWLKGLARPARGLTGTTVLGGVAFAIAIAIVPAAQAVVHDIAPTALKLRWSQAALDPATGLAYREAQQKIPAEATLLAVHLPHADLLDVRRNPVLAADQAARAGPSPGWPQITSGGALTAYLRSSGVDYVAVSHALFDRLEDDTTAWERRLRASRLLARRQFLEATATARPVVEGPGFRIYAVADLI